MYNIFKMEKGPDMGAHTRPLGTWVVEVSSKDQEFKVIFIHPVI